MLVFSIKNTLSGTYRGLFLYRTDKEAGRSLYGVCHTLFPDCDISELQLIKHGEFDVETGTLTSYPAETIVSWNPKGSFESRSKDVPIEKAEKDFEDMK